MPARIAPPAKFRMRPRVRASARAALWQLDRNPLLAPLSIRPTRREFLAGAGSLLVLGAAGCGGPADSGSSGETRTVRHADGEAEVPVDLERIVALDPVMLTTLIALGVKPVAAPEADAGGSEALGLPYLEGRTEGIESLGKESQINLEKIATLDPQLLIGAGPLVGDALKPYDRLTRIAPTASVEYDFREFKDFLRDTGEIVGRPDKADELIADYDARIRDFRDAMGGRLAETEVSVVRFSSSGVYLRISDFGPAIMDEAGLSRPPNQRFDPDSEEYSMDLSLEIIPEIDADAIFVYVDELDQAEGEEILRTYEENPLWAGLEAVKAGRVYQVEAGPWVQPSVTTANLVLDDLERHLLNGGGN